MKVVIATNGRAGEHPYLPLSLGSSDCSDIEAIEINTRETARKETKCQ